MGHLAASLLALALAVHTPPAEAKLVFRNGTTLLVRSYAVDGNVIHVVSLKGEPQILRAGLVDLRRSEAATAAHRARLAEEVRKETASEQAEVDKRARQEEANAAHRAQSSGRRGITIGAGDKAQVVEDQPYQSSSEKRDAMRAALARPDRVLLYFQAEHCADCRRFESEVLSQPVVTRALEGYELRSIDIEAEPEAAVARKHGIRKVPAFVVLDSSDQVLGSYRGYQPADAFAAWLQR